MNLRRKNSNRKEGEFPEEEVSSDKSRIGMNLIMSRRKKGTEQKGSSNA
jgi:hypothetical protein